MSLAVDASEPTLERLLPESWAKTHPECVLAHRLEESREKARRQSERRANRRGR